MSSTTKEQRICFVSTPLGIKVHPWNGFDIDFDDLYASAIKPAVEAEGGVCFRGDEELSDSAIHKPILSRLIRADVLIVDLTIANPKAFYELGIRHATRSRTTIPIVEKDAWGPSFGLFLERPVIYTLQNGSLTPQSAVKLTNELRGRLSEAFNSEGQTDSPVFLFLDDFPGVDLAKVEKTAELFLSYAHKDRERVEAVYDELRENGFLPWLDVRNILPGERWEARINQAIERTDFFLAFLSPNSIDRRGVLQKELQQALEKWKGMLEEDIYLIPVRLEECEIPNELKGFQVLDLFDTDWLNRLALGINLGMEKRVAD